MNREELAWAAGFFDGEGCFTISRRRDVLTFTVAVVQRDERPLQRFRNAVGFGRIYAHNGGMKRWQVGSFEQSQATVALLWPFLSGPKRDDATRALSSMRSYFESKGLVRIPVRKSGSHVARLTGRLGGAPRSCSNPNHRPYVRVGRHMRCRDCHNEASRRYRARKAASRTTWSPDG